jgi:hypothetical protein
VTRVPEFEPLSYANSFQKALTCYLRGAQDAFVLGIGKGKNLLSMNPLDIFGVRDLILSLAQIHSTMDLLPPQPSAHFSFSLNPSKNKAMKITLTSNFRPLLRAFYPFVIAIAVLWAMPRNAHAQLYVTQRGAGIVGEYDATTGFAINANFITGLNGPNGLAVKGNTLFVVNLGNGTVGEYDAKTGAAINPNFIAELSSPFQIVLLGNTLFVVNNGNSTVGEYDAKTGAAINANLSRG